MKKIFYRFAAVLAFIIGAMAVIAGGQVLFGKTPGYFVIGWLPAYNLIMGILTIFITSVLIWKFSPYAMMAASVTFSIHAVIMLILQVFYRDVVAIDSILAMILRLVTWLIILVLLFFGIRKSKLSAAKSHSGDQVTISEK